MDAEQEVEKRKADEALVRAQRKADWSALLRTPEGRRSLALVIFEFCGLEASVHSSSEHQSKFNDGQRIVAIVLQRELKLADYDGWMKMRAEWDERGRSEFQDPKPNKTDQ